MDCDTYVRTYPRSTKFTIVKMNIFELIERRTIASWRLRLANRWLTRSGLGTVLDNANGALVPQAVDLRNLYKNVISRRPSVILEFGVGHSTIVMAEALREVGGRFLPSTQI